MSRVIKFRAWDSDEDRYWTQEEMTEIGGYYYSYGVELPEYEEEKFSLEQFTGLQDSKGVDIYEGDIITDRALGTGGVYFNDEMGAFSWDKGMDWGMIEPEDCEVIGNIHQNKDLLK